jgi:hypothetical protein
VEYHGKMTKAVGAQMRGLSLRLQAIAFRSSDTVEKKRKREHKKIHEEEFPDDKVITPVRGNLPL